MKEILHQDYYGGDSTYEAIKVIQAWHLNFSLGSVVKYIRRAGVKSGESKLDDLLKAKQYIEFEIEQTKANQSIKYPIGKNTD